LNILYGSQLAGILIDEFIDDYEQDIRVINVNVEYKLRFSWVCDVYEQGEKVELIDYVAFEAFGKMNIKEDTEDYPISIALSSLSEIKDTLVFSDNSFEIKDYKTYDNEIDSIFKASYRPFTLYDIIGSILREITHFGNPEERENAIKDAIEQSKDMQKWEEEGVLEEYVKDKYDVKEEIGDMIDNEFDEDDKQSFWDVLYPSEAPVGRSSQEVIDGAIIALSEGADIPLEEQLAEALSEEDYRRAKKIQALIDKRDKKK
jgi:hypothetical protein